MVRHHADGLQLVAGEHVRFVDREDDVPVPLVGLGGECCLDLGDEGGVVAAVDVFLAEMQAAGRSAATQRSYALDLLRWLRFCWAIEVPWDQATSCEGRDFIRWMMSTVKPARPHWRTGQVPDRAGGAAPGR